MKSVQDFFNSLKSKIVEREGKPGVVALREQYDKLSKSHLNYLMRMGYFGNGIDKMKNEKKICMRFHRDREQYTCFRQSVERTITFRRQKKAAIEAAKTIEPKYYRGNYDEIVIQYPEPDHNTYGIFANIPVEAAKKLFTEYHSIIDQINKSDEHGHWENYSEWDKRGVGSSLSIDLYGFDIVRNLYVVLVRQSVRSVASHYLQVRKNYFLIGRNENGNPFAHCVNAGAIRAGIRKDDHYEAAVSAALRWIWNTDRYREVIRHGDVGLLPVRQVPRVKPTGERVIMIVDNHQLYSPEIRKNGSIFAKNPYMHHIKHQHPDIKVVGWTKVVIGRREKFWSFAKPTVD